MGTNTKLLDFFTTNYKPGLIAVVGTNDAIGLAIREAQKEITTDKKPSLWSHCFILGEMRFDLNGTNNTKMKSPYIFESDLHVNLFEPQVRNGAQENWIGKWCSDEVENAALIDFQISADKTDTVLATALQLVDEQVLYSIKDLIGTWLAVTTLKQWLPNPLHDEHAMYCSAFVRWCYQQSEVDFIDNAIDVFNTTPEDVAQAGTTKKAIKIYSAK